MMPFFLPQRYSAHPLWWPQIKNSITRRGRSWKPNWSRSLPGYTKSPACRPHRYIHPTRKAISGVRDGGWRSCCVNSLIVYNRMRYHVCVETGSNCPSPLVGDWQIVSPARDFSYPWVPVAYPPWTRVHFSWKDLDVYKKILSTYYRITTFLTLTGTKLQSKICTQQPLIRENIKACRSAYVPVLYSSDVWSQPCSYQNEWDTVRYTISRCGGGILPYLQYWVVPCLLLFPDRDRF